MVPPFGSVMKPVFHSLAFLSYLIGFTLRLFREKKDFAFFEVLQSDYAVGWTERCIYMQVEPSGLLILGYSNLTLYRANLLYWFILK